MTEAEKRQFAQHVALQLLFFEGRKEKNRMLNQEEMDKANETAREFLDWFFGPLKSNLPHR